MSPVTGHRSPVHRSRATKPGVSGRRAWSGRQRPPPAAVHRSRPPADRRAEGIDGPRPWAATVPAYRQAGGHGWWPPATAVHQCLVRPTTS